MINKCDIIRLMVGLLILLTLGCSASTLDRPSQFLGGSELILAGSSDRPIEFTAQDLNHNRLTLADFKDKLVVLNFWAPWCPPCLAELDSLERLHKLGADHNIAVIGVAVDSVATNVKRIVREHGLSYPNVIDIKNKLRDYVRADRLPMTIILGRGGMPVLFANRKTGQVQSQLVGAREWNSEAILKSLYKISGDYNGSQK